MSYIQWLKEKGYNNPNQDNRIDDFDNDIEEKEQQEDRWQETMAELELIEKEND
jgi:hypothetical protein